MSTSGKEEITQAEAAKRLGMTAQALGMWAKRPGAPVVMRAGKPRCVWPDFPKWRDAERDRQAREEATPADEEEAKRRKLVAEARLAEIELELAEGKLVSKDAVLAEADAQLGPIRSAMLAIPAKWAPKVVGLRNVVEAQTALKALVKHSLGQWASVADD